MSDRHTIRHQGGTYEVHRRDSAHVTPGAETPGDSVWEVTRDGASITSFPVSDDDTSASVREKVMAWLTANEDRPEQDVGRN
ncbi:MAG: hypothetical protein H0U85_00320 [Gemmatimonadales bacterium]|nr:hypothetical protein [Gemmatimonadales bacterium]